MRREVDDVSIDDKLYIVAGGIIGVFITLLDLRELNFGCGFASVGGCQMFTRVVVEIIILLEATELLSSSSSSMSQKALQYCSEHHRLCWLAW